MMFRGGGDIQEAKIAWRRPTLGEAFNRGCLYFTVLMIAPVLWDFAMGNDANYERIFVSALVGGAAFGIASLPFKSKMVVLR